MLLYRVYIGKPFFVKKEYKTVVKIVSAAEVAL
jgi:hypothetical protein